MKGDVFKGPILLGTPGADLNLGPGGPGWTLGAWPGTSGLGCVDPGPLVTSEGDLKKWLALAAQGKLPKAPLPKGQKVYHKSGSDEHGTPQALFDVLDQEFGLTLDVCATAPHEVPGTSQFTHSVLKSLVEPELDPGNAKCPIYFTKEDDGLAQDWFGRVWMNPPYTKKQIGVWVSKLVQELVDGKIDLAVALVAARPDTKWWGKVATYASEIRFLKGRLTFEPNKWAAPFPSAVCIFDPTRTNQRIVFWDWQKGWANCYWKCQPESYPLYGGALSDWPGAWGLG